MTNSPVRNTTHSIGFLTDLILNKLQTRARLQEQQRQEEQNAEQGEDQKRADDKKATHRRFAVVPRETKISLHGCLDRR